MYSNDYCNFSTNKLIRQKLFFPTFVVWLISMSFSQAQVKGKVFRDYNGSGSQDSTSTPLFREIGVAGVTVTATNGVLTATATTGSFGDYAFPNSGATASGQKVRIEFSAIPAGNFSGFHGTANTFSGTSVQFVTAGTAARAHLGVNIPEEYCQSNPLIALGCYENGNAIYTVSGNTHPGFITLPYNSSGSARTEMSSNIQILQIGTTWGNAWQKAQKRVFTSAILKRHSGLGPQGLGGLYMIDYSTSAGGSLLNAFNLQGITPGNGGAAIDLGSVDRTGANALPNNTSDDSRDIDAFGKIGKVGFGGIDIADNDHFLWMVNLNQKALIKMDVSAATPTPSTATVNQYPIAGFSGLPTCTNGELRPWALKFHGGKGYLGVVCSAEGAGGVAANLHAYVLSFNPSNPTAFTTELSFPLNYTREPATFFGSSLSGSWNPWADTWAETGLTGGGNANSFNERAFAQPILSDIEFSDTGLDLGFLDRFGLQGGFKNLTPQASPTTLYLSVDVAGDIIHYCKVGNSYVQEGSTGCAVLDNTTNSTSGSDGPGGDGEFYYAESYNDTDVNPTFNHNETSLGGLAVLKGSQEILNNVFDPISGTQDATAFTQGLHWYNTSTGAKTDQYLIVPNATNNPQYFGKAGGLGDPELLCNAAPLEIGNRFWKDTDNDGIQDAGEDGINGVEIELYKGATLLATVTTATVAGQSGTWYFSSKSRLGSAWVGTGADTTLLPATAYSIKVKTALGAGALATYTAFSTKDATTDEIDSDVNPDGTLSYTTGSYGENNHTLDIGVTECVSPVITATSAQILCQGETAGAFTMNITSGTVSSQKWYGPIANNLPTTSLGTAIPGATLTTFTPSAAQLPAADGVTRYYAVVGEGSSSTCSDTAYVAITVKPKPNAGNPQTVCAGTSATLTGTSPSTGTWTAQAGPANPAGAILGSTTAGIANVSFASNTSGIFKFVYTVNGCTDTVQITVNAKPNAGADIIGASAICNTIATVILPEAAANESWSQLGVLPKVVTVNPSSGLVTDMDAIGTYQFILHNSITNCADTVAVEVKNCFKGSLGDFIWKDTDNDGQQDAGEIGVQGVIVQLFKDASVIAIDTTDANGFYGFNNLISGNYQVKIDTASLPAGCIISTKHNEAGVADSLDSDFDPATALSQIVVIDVLGTGLNKDNPTIDAALYSPKGSIGDFVWKDTNDNGIQDSGEIGVENVILQLYKGSTTGIAIATDTTDSNGAYTFTNLDAGNYYVKVVTSSLPPVCVLSDSTNKGGDDAKDSDIDPTTGFSPQVVIDPIYPGLMQDNPTIDVALVKPCIKPVWTLTATPQCSPINPVYQVSFSVANPNGNLKVNVGTLTGAGPNYTVTDIPAGTNLIITDSLSAVCKFDTTIAAPNCSCPQIIVLTPAAIACIGDTLPTLQINIIGSAGAEWYADNTGGTALASGLSFKPSGTVTATDTFYVQLTGTTSLCSEEPRIPVIVTAKDCSVDLALKKLISKKTAQIGDTITYTIKVWNEFDNPASNVQVIDSIATSVLLIPNSFSPSRGTANIVGNAIQWNIGNMAPNGDTVTLSYQIKVTQEGIHFNTAEISNTDQKDRDSTPNNGKEDEDDMDRQCFTVPIKLCAGEKVQVSVPAKYTGVQWFKAGEAAAVAVGNQVMFTETGTYTFTALNNTCPLEGCCPIIIEPGDNCCPEQICIPFTIKQSKKAGKKIL